MEYPHLRPQGSCLYLPARFLGCLCHRYVVSLPGWSHCWRQSWEGMGERESVHIGSSDQLTSASSSSTDKLFSVCHEAARKLPMWVVGVHRSLSLLPKQTPHNAFRTSGFNSNMRKREAAAGCDILAHTRGHPQSSAAGIVSGVPLAAASGVGGEESAATMPKYNKGAVKELCEKVGVGSCLF